MLDHFSDILCATRMVWHLLKVLTNKKPFCCCILFFYYFCRLFYTAMFLSMPCSIFGYLKTHLVPTLLHIQFAFFDSAFLPSLFCQSGHENKYGFNTQYLGPRSSDFCYINQFCYHSVKAPGISSGVFFHLTGAPKYRDSFWILLRQSHFYGVSCISDSPCICWNVVSSGS